MDHDEVFEDNWTNKKGEWIDYVKNDVSCKAFGYPRYSEGIEKMSSFGMKNSLTLPSLGWRYFTSLRDESDEPIYTYRDKDMRWFVRQIIKGVLLLINITNPK